MEPLDPLLQYGPNDGGYLGALKIALAVITVLVGSWLFGAAYALITKYNKAKDDENKN